MIFTTTLNPQEWSSAFEQAETYRFSEIPQVEKESPRSGGRN